MRLRNGLFAQAIDWLYKTGKVKDQKELSVLTGITETTISRILNDKVKGGPSELTLRRLDNAFKGIFNMDYFRGKSTALLLEDSSYYMAHPKEHPFYVDHEKEIHQNKVEIDVGSSSSISAAESDPEPFIPSWADSLIEIMTDQIKQNEALNRELHKSISEVNTLLETLKEITKSLKK